MYTTPAGQTVRRHPIRGFFWGLLMGIGITVLLIVTNTVAIGTIAPWLVLVFSTMFGILWGLFAPPRKAKDEPTIPVEPVAAAAPAAAGAVAGEPEKAEPVGPEQAAEPMTPEQTAASRETVIGPGGVDERSGTIADAPAGADEAATGTDEPPTGADDPAD